MVVVGGSVLLVVVVGLLAVSTLCPPPRLLTAKAAIATTIITTIVAPIAVRRRARRCCVRRRAERGVAGVSGGTMTRASVTTRSSRRRAAHRGVRSGAAYDPHAMRRLSHLRLEPAAYRRITLVATILLGVIIVTGGAVRLTGSGLGCPDWPTCSPGHLTPHGVSDGHAVIEFVNRTFTGLVSFVVVICVLGSLVRTPRRRDLVWLSVGLVAGVMAQIVLGGLTVLFDLQPPFVMGHFLLSLVLLTNALVLHRRAGQPDAPARSVVASPVRTAGRAMVAARGRGRDCRHRRHVDRSARRRPKGEAL